MSNVQVKERPILFSAPMVRAILEGRKTQTRRIMKPQPPTEATFAGLLTTSNPKDDQTWHWCEGHERDCDTWGMLNVDSRCPYGNPGDRLWVRETFWHQPVSFGEVCGIKYQDGDEATIFRADGEAEGIDKWTPSIFMPRALSRITLEITDVRVQRVQEISVRDALAEGAPAVPPFPASVTAPEDHLTGFRELWESIHGPGSWDANPWVWALTFKPIEGRR